MTGEIYLVMETWYPATVEEESVPVAAVIQRSDAEWLVEQLRKKSRDPGQRFNVRTVEIHNASLLSLAALQREVIDGEVDRVW